MIQSILTLYSQGWSARRIARELQVNRETVSRYIRTLAATGVVEPAKPANAPISDLGSAAVSKPANAPIVAVGLILYQHAFDIL